MIYIIVIHYKNILDTKECIESIILDDVESKIILVSNSENDDENIELHKILQKHEDRIDFLFNNKNEGFSEGNNIGIKYILNKDNISDNDYVFILNNDARIEKNFFEKILIGNFDIVFPRIIGFDNKIDSMGINFTTSGLSFNRINEFSTIFCPTGCCAGYRIRVIKDVIQSHGYFFDKDYFCYAEDLDLGFRTIILGYKSNYINDAVVYHKGSASTGKMSEFSIYYSYRNIIWTIIKCYPLLFILKYFIRIILVRFGLLILSIKRKQFKIYLKSFLHGFKNFRQNIEKRKKIFSNLRIDNKVLLEYFTKSIIVKDYINNIKK